MSASVRVQKFFLGFIAVPVVVAFYLGHKLWLKTPMFIKAKDMDIDTGRRDLNTKELITEEKAERDSWPSWKKAYKFIC